MCEHVGNVMSLMKFLLWKKSWNGNFWLLLNLHLSSAPGSPSNSALEGMVLCQSCCSPCPCAALQSSAGCWPWPHSDAGLLWGSSSGWSWKRCNYHYSGSSSQPCACSSAAARGAGYRWCTGMAAPWRCRKEKLQPAGEVCLNSSQSWGIGRLLPSKEICCGITKCKVTYLRMSNASCMYGRGNSAQENTESGRF